MERCVSHLIKINVYKTEIRNYLVKIKISFVDLSEREIAKKKGNKVKCHVPLLHCHLEFLNPISSGIMQL